MGTGEYLAQSTTVPEMVTSPVKRGVEFLGDFGTEETPFTVSVDQLGLRHFLTDTIGLSPEQIRNLSIRIAGYGVSPTQAMEHPVSKLAAFFSMMKPAMVGGLVEERQSGNKRTITIFMDDIFRQVTGDAQTAIGRYFKKPSTEGVETIQKLFPDTKAPQEIEPRSDDPLAGYRLIYGTDSSRRLERYLKEAPPERAREFILYLSRSVARRRMQQAVARSLAYVAKHGYPSRKELLAAVLRTEGAMIVAGLGAIALFSKLTPEIPLSWWTLPVGSSFALAEFMKLSSESELQGYRGEKELKRIGKGGVTGNLSNIVKVNFSPDLLEKYAAARSQKPI